MMTDIEIAQSVTPRHILEIAKEAGIDEKYITGDASWHDKFVAYATMLAYAPGNPLYHWSHLELRRYFDCDLIINEKNCDEIWRITSEKFAKGGMSARALMVKSGVKLVCTTDDPADSLEYHKALAHEGFEVKVLPAFRPDKAMRADKADFPQYVARLEKVVGYEINSVADMRRALADRIAYFNDRGCRISDHGLDLCFYVEATEEQLNDIFARAKAGQAITANQQLAYHTALLLAVGQEYAKRGWVMQLHFDAKRLKRD